MLRLRSHEHHSILPLGAHIDQRLSLASCFPALQFDRFVRIIVILVNSRFLVERLFYVL